MSTSHRPPEGPTPENMVSYSEQLLALSIARLTRLLEGYDEITPQTGKELAEEFRSLRKALEIAYHERANIQKLKGLGPVGGGAALDLDAARDEIARRLDRLRTAGGAAELS
ncbi:hypothetical protein [Roseibaca sp. Y0-43]|uniref:hypothetical protein n=1 Tax=Roseibaca sp. Y0-43 TaxID=2816854 RepID=UPI001D0C36E7|nr:hypothetical protein [Roseibaca sp. Y0-43]MCC1481459.1 hypothetical protein [Roseibaca sp. Y0-43]